MIPCKACEESFHNNNHFIRHVHLTHSGLNFFQCTETYCSKTFTILDSFIKHRRAKHSEKSENIIKSKKNESVQFVNLDLQCQAEITSENDIFINDRVELSDSSDSEFAG